MQFLRVNRGIVQFQERSIEQLLAARQLTNEASESGGMLIGRLIVSCDDVVVDEVTLPSPNDKKSRFSFFRSKKHSQRIVDAAWAKSYGTSIYLGEWHTHPEDDPSPSQGVDIPSWRTIVRKTHFEQDFLLFVIAGRELIRAWEISKGSNEVQSLEQVAA